MKNKWFGAKIWFLTPLIVGVCAGHNVFAATTNVSFSNFAFNPVVITVNVGDTIIWTDAGGFHTVTGTGTEPLCGGSSFSAVGQTCVHTFTTAGSFPYQCNFHGASFGMTGLVNVASVAVPPTVSITNPAGGTVFAAPANVSIKASASSSSGSVTNVTFFANASSLGSVTAPPFNFIASNLSAGSYALTAVASAGGLAATSAAVNISAVTPLAVSNSAPIITNGHFTFKYTANPGLSYVVQNSSNLSNWVPLSTNVAATTPVPFSDTFFSNSLRFYRVGRVPNP